MPQITSADLQLSVALKSVNATDQTLVVRNNPAKPLPIGLNVFTLVVTDNAGNRSQAARAEVIVRDTTAPTAVVRPPTQTISFGQDFTLDGSDSSDIGGQVVAWEWTLVQQP